MGDRLENTGQDLKGRAKEAAGAIKDDDEMKNEGKMDQAKSAVKDKVDDLAEKVKNKLD